MAKNCFFKTLYFKMYVLDPYKTSYGTCIEPSYTLSTNKIISHRYTQCDENTARQFRALRLAAMGELMPVAVSPLTLPRLSASNAGKSSNENGAVPECMSGGNGRTPRKSASGPAGNRTLFALVGSSYFTTAAPTACLPPKRNGFFLVGNILDDAAGRRVFSGTSLFPAFAFRFCSMLTSLHPLRLSLLNIFTHSLSRRFRAVVIGSIEFLTGNALDFAGVAANEMIASLLSVIVRAARQGHCMGRCRWLVGFFEDLPLHPPLDSDASSYSPRFTITGSQDLDVKSGQISSLTLYYVDKIDFKRVYTEVTFATGLEFIRHALDDSAPIADLRGNKKRIPYCQMWGNTGSTANEQTSEVRLYEGVWSLACSSGNHVGQCLCSGGFLWDLPFPPLFHSGGAPYSPLSPSSSLKCPLLRAAQISSLIRPPNLPYSSLLVHGARYEEA
ncbi:hypothetical protein PR048_012143, partial [Dryococelus australis]